MKLNLKNYAAPFLVILFAGLMCVYWGVQKENMFIDELYTLSASNGVYPPFIDSEASICGDTMMDQVIKADEFEDLISAADNRFDFGAVYENHSRDLHPPLYGFLLHATSSIFESVGMHNIKWQGLILNIFLYVLILFVLYKLIMTLFKNRWAATVTVLLYGLSVMGISAVMMIRMYILLTFFTVLLAYCIVCFLQSEKWFYYPIIGLVILGGMFTQYYFVYYAFFVCAGVDLYALIKRKYKMLALFSVSALLGVLCLYLIYSACINPFLTGTDVSGQSVFGNLLVPANYGLKLFRYILYLVNSMRVIVLAGILLTAIFLILAIKEKSVKKALCNSTIAQTAIIVVPALFALIMIGAGNLDKSQPIQYIFNLAPILSVIVACGLWLIGNLKFPYVRKSWVKVSATAIAITVAIVFAFIRSENFIYPQFKTYNTEIAARADAPVVYITPDWNAPLMQDCLQLMKFEDVFVTDNTASEWMKQYIAENGNPTEVVVYINTCMTWGPGGYDPVVVMNELTENTIYSEYEELYTFERSATYLLKRK